MSYSKGIMWLDDCRIPFVDDGLEQHIQKYNNGYGGDGKSIFNTNKNTKIYGDTKGRFTPNLLVCDNMLNDGSIGGSSLFPKTNTPIYNTKNGWNDNNISGSTGGGYSDKGTNSRYYDLDLWFDKMLEKL